MNDVYVRIVRPDDYKDVCPDLVIEDAIPSTAFEIEDATAEVASLRAENAALKEQLAHIGCAGMSAMPKKIGGGP